MNILSRLLVLPKAKRIYRLSKLLAKAEMRSDYRRACMLQKHIVDIYLGGL